MLQLPHGPESDDEWSLSKRLDRAIGNTVENVAIDLGAICLGLALGGEKQCDLQRKLLIGYTACRVGHTLCYLGKIQPFRTLCYFGSKICVGVIAFKGYKNLSS